MREGCKTCLGTTHTISFAPVQSTLRGHLLRDPQTRFAGSLNHFLDFSHLGPISQASNFSNLGWWTEGFRATRLCPSQSFGTSFYLCTLSDQKKREFLRHFLHAISWGNSIFFSPEDPYRPELGGVAVNPKSKKQALKNTVKPVIFED